MSKLILLRHGQSEWNKKNVFTGWVDIPLSPKGIEEALEAGKSIDHLPVDLIYCSTLVRAMMTAMLAMSTHSSHKVCVVHHPEKSRLGQWGKYYSDQMAEETIPVRCSWHLNERMYGELQGKNKEQLRQEVGVEQVQIWRRSYDVAPPEGESLKMTAERTLPFFDKEIIPQLNAGKNVMISAHGNSLRSIVMELDGLTEKEVVALEIPTGAPIIYDFQEGRWSRVE